MRAILSRRHSAVADLQHVRIVPVARTGMRFQSILKIENMDHTHAAPVTFAVPTILNVASRAPEISNVAGPQPRLCRSPLANTKHDRPAGFEKRVAHDRVGSLRVLRTRRAPVVLQIVDSPGCILPRVLKLVTTTTRPLLTRERAGVRIET